MNIAISIITLILILIIKIINIKKYKSINKESTLLKKEKKLVIITFILSIIIFIISLLINKYLLSIKLLDSFISALSLFILVCPISIHNLYNTYFTNEEDTAYIKTIITNKIIDKSLLKKINSSNINVVIISTKPNDLKLPTIKKDEITIKHMRNNTIISTTSKKDIIDKYNSKLNFIYTEDIENTYNEIIKSREVCDNYTRTIKYNFITYLSLILSIFFINYIMNFPFNYNITLSLLLKLFTLIISIIIYKNIPSDEDIPTRKPKDKNIYIYKEEVLLVLFQTLPIMIGLSMPYMYFLASSAAQTFANTIFYLTLIISNIFLTFVYLSESLTIKNIFKIIKNKYLLIYTIILVLICLPIYYLNIFNTERIGLQNILACIVVSLMSTLIYDLTKFARYTSVKGSKKHGTKNNKKHRRS